MQLGILLCVCEVGFFVWLFFLDVEHLLLLFSVSPFPFFSLLIEGIAVGFAHLAPICWTARLILNSSGSPLVANSQSTKTTSRELHIFVLVDSIISTGVCRSQFCIGIHLKFCYSVYKALIW